MPTDTERMDWVERQTNGDDWIARMSDRGRGFRLHNSTRTFKDKDAGFECRTAREAIDIAMSRDATSRLR